MEISKLVGNKSTSYVAWVFKELGIWDTETGTHRTKPVSVIEVPYELTQDEKNVVEFLRAPKPKWWLQPESEKEKIRNFIRHFHLEKGVSLTDIGKWVGKNSGYISHMTRVLGIRPRPKEEARQESMIKLRKYERKPFEGTDEDKAYMLGLKHGDLSAYVPFGDATRVSTSTTHPALANLFTELFSRYGRVYEHSRYKKEQNKYEWNLEAILDNSFGFLLESREKCREWILSKPSLMLAYLAGLIDAEGHIRIYPNPRTIGIIVSIWNTDTSLIEFSYKCLRQLGYRPMRPYLDKRKGGRSSGFQIERKKDYWRLQLGRVEEAQSLLRRLPLRHREKVAIKEIALSVTKGDFYENIRAKVESLRKSFKEETAEFTKQAELEFLAGHPKDGNPVPPLPQI
jgi:hypothetical protein